MDDTISPERAAVDLFNSEENCFVQSYNNNEYCRFNSSWYHRHKDDLGYTTWAVVEYPYVGGYITKTKPFPEELLPGLIADILTES